MKKQTETSLLALSEAIGDFIRYWGFRRVHGQIWTQIFLSAQPLSGSDLTRRLGVSKALVSPALKELQAHNLIFIQSESGKSKKYIANPKVFEVIKSILLEREVKILQRIETAFEGLKLSAKVPADESLDSERMKELDEMIASAQSFATILVSQF